MNTCPIPPPASGYVLAVDDNSAVRVLLKTVLTNAGLSVQLAANGAEALALLCEDDNRIELVILDLNMPVMAGPEFIQELVRQNKSLPILLCSGSVTMMAEAVARSDGLVIELIQKPFCIHTLTQKVLEALGRVRSLAVDVAA